MPFMMPQQRTISVMTMLFHSNLAWLMHTVANPRATNRLDVIEQYLARNHDRFDGTALQAAMKMQRCAPRERLLYYDRLFYLLWEQTPCPGADKPNRQIIKQYKRELAR